MARGTADVARVGVHSARVHRHVRRACQRHHPQLHRAILAQNQGRRRPAFGASVVVRACAHVRVGVCRACRGTNTHRSCTQVFSNLRTHAEAIAAYGGGARELSLLESRLNDALARSRALFRTQGWFGVLQDYIAKYVHAGGGCV